MRFVACVLVAGVVACAPGLDVPEGTAIECKTQDECPANFVCQVSLSRCVPLGYDVTPPQIVDGSTSITPKDVGASSVVTITFESTKHLGLDPDVEINFGGTIQKKATLAGKNDDATAFTYTYTPDKTEPESYASVVITLTDVVGNQGVGETPRALLFDFTPPSVLDGTVTQVITPADTSILETVAALSTGGTITINFQASEQLSMDTTVAVDGAPLPFNQSAVLGQLYTYTGVYPAGLTGVDGSHGIAINAIDLAGNVGTYTLPAPLTIDTVAPSAPAVATRDAIVYYRAPWLAGGTFAVSAIAGSIEPNATVAVLDDADNVLGIHNADGTGALASLPLQTADHQSIFLRVIDAAGNSTAKAQVLDVDWVASYGASDGGPSPHTAYTFPNLPVGVALATSTRIDTSGFVTAGDNITVSAVLDRRWTQKTISDVFGQVSSSQVSSRYFGSAAFDIVHNQIVVFGGGDVNATNAGFDLYGTQRFQLWSGQQWSTPTNVDLPARRLGGAMAYDPAHAQIVLYGGMSGNTVYDDTWIWDGTSWIPADDSGPGGITFAAMAWSPVLGKIVLFGGCFDNVCSDISQDTWTWDGTSWAPLNPTTKPSPRFGHSLTTYKNNLILFGGCPDTQSSFDPTASSLDCGAYLNDYWTFDGTNWIPSSPSGRPSPRAFHAAAADATTYYIYGGGPLEVTDQNFYATTNGTSFTATDGGVPSTTGQIGVYNSVSGAPFIFDGVSDPGMGNQPQLDVYEIRNGLMLRVDPNDTPSRRMTSGLTYFPDIKFTVASGGRNLVLGDSRNGSGLWDGFNWHLFGSDVPGVGTGGCAGGSPGGELSAYDATRKVLVQLCDNRTFEFGVAKSWNEVCTTAGCRGTLPSSTDGYAMTYDTVHQKTLAFGGGNASAPGTAFTSTLYGYGGTSWATLATGGPGARRCSAMAYDSIRQRTVLFGGGAYSGVSGSNDYFCGDWQDDDNNDNVLLNDTWEWNGTAWSSVCSNCAPPKTWNPLLIYDSGRGRTIFFSQGRTQLWEWDGTTWRYVTPNGGPQPASRRAAAMAYDPVRHVVQVFGGRAGDSFNDIWEWDADAGSRPSVLLAFDWSRAGVPRNDVRSITIDATAGGFGSTTDLSTSDDADLIGTRSAGVRVEGYAPDTGWTTIASNATADTTALGEITQAVTTGCGHALMNAANNTIYARISPLSGSGNGASPSTLVVDAAQVTVRYTIGLNATGCE